jgi:PIN domain nuclease of toxin-antitoxin system
VRLLLDTAVLIFAVESPDRMSKRAASALQEPANILELSTVSLTEIAIKVSSEKLEFTADEARQAIDDLGLRVLPFSVEHAFRLFGLPLHHRDPFDRQIIAQALVEDIPVLTPDEKFHFYKGLKVVW